MKIVMAFLLFAAIVNADFMGGRTQEHQADLQRRVFDGEASYRGQHRYIASIQLNGLHICSSGLFQMGFLLTIVECVWHLGKAIKKQEQRATAVFANSSSENRQRINIHKIAYCYRYDDYKDDVGVIMLVDNYDQTHMDSLNTYPKSVDLRRYGPGASVCEWATNDPLHNVEFEDAKFPGNLHCMAIQLHSDRPCRKHIPFGEYKRKLMCGTSYDPEEIPTVENLGSPVTKIVYIDDRIENVILGVTIRPHVHKNVTFFRFIRISFVFDDIQAILEELKCKTGANEACVSEC